MTTSMNSTLAAVLAGSIAAASWASGECVPQLLDDFSRFADSAWGHVDQTAEICDKPATYDASGSEYRLESSCALDDETEAIIAARWHQEPVDANAAVRVKVRHLNAESNAFISLRSWGSESIGIWGYRYRVSGDGSFLSISRVWEHGSDIILTALDAPVKLFATGDEIYIEASAIGERLSLKVWRAGDREPTYPQLVTHDRVFGWAGSLVIGLDHDGPAAVVGAAFDDVVFTPAVPGDVDGDCTVDFADLLQVLSDWGICDLCPSNASGDGSVDLEDLVVVLANWS